MLMNVTASVRLLVQAAGVILCAGLLSPTALAQARGPALAETLQRADQLYRAEKLPQAEELYSQALKTAEGADRRRCFDRLLTIYVRVGRQDRAIQTGLQYEGWLRKLNDPARVRELNLDLGRWYLDLGHYVAAEPYLRRALADVEGNPLPPDSQVAALTCLALTAEKQGDRDRAVQ